MFKFRRRVTYYETDAMAVVHHSNYVRYFEEARVQWLRENGLMKFHAPSGPFVFAVHEMTTQFQRPLKFDDEIEIAMQVKLDGVRIRLQYAITRLEPQGAADGAPEVLAATGTTVLIPLGADFKPARLPLEARQIFSSGEWSNSWPH